MKKLLPAVFFLVSALAIQGADSLFSANANKVVYFVPQFSEFKEIAANDLYFLKKTLRRAEQDKVKAVIFELDTPGGRIDVALKYISVLARAKVPVIAYLNPQGISAGMVIALGADRIAINPNGVIGDAMPIQMSTQGIKPITEKRTSDDTKKTEKKSKEVKKDSKKTEKTAENDKVKNKDKKSDKDTSKDTPNLEKFKRELLEELKKNNLLKKKDDGSEAEQQLAKQKFLTVYFKVLQVLAEKNNRPVRVIRATADPYQKLSLKEDGIEHTKCSPLTLSAKEAKKLNVVDYICKNRYELLEQLGLADCEMKIIEKSAVEQIVSFLAHPALAAILLILGIIGLYVEIRTPGFGVPGLMGVTALTLFFLGHVGSGASEWGPMVIFFVGLILLALEIFVIPGFGITGILGIICILISFFGAFGIENFETASYVIGTSVIVSCILIALMTFYLLPKSTLFDRLKLKTAQNSADGYNSHKDADMTLMDCEGVAFTSLRPVGVAVINGKKYEVNSDGEFIAKGSAVKVTEVSNMKITVKELNPDIS